MKPFLCCLVLCCLWLHGQAKPPKPEDVPPGYREYVKHYSDTATYSKYLEMLAQKNFCTIADTAGIFPYNQLDKKPEFAGGEQAMIAFIQKNIKLPRLAMEINKPGKVLLKFLIDENGRICNVQFVNYGGYGMDEEALRVLLAMNNWVPAVKDSIAVRSYYYLPIKFNFIIQK